MSNKDNEVLEDPVGCDPWRRFSAILKRLRSPDGCPWDKQQTYRSLTAFVLEEAYEVVEAALEGDADKLKEELGDLLLEIGLYAVIAEEKRDFTLIDVVNGISDKLIRRHPHVFGYEKAETPEQVEKIWDAVKKEEREKRGETVSAMDEIDKRLPALMRAQQQQEIAARNGFDWLDVSGVFDKIDEEVLELRDAFKQKNPLQMVDEMGDLLFACVNLARHLGIGAEVALGLAINKFSKRFRYMENCLKCRNQTMENAGLKALDDLWEKAKLNAVQKRD